MRTGLTRAPVKRDDWQHLACSSADELAHWLNGFEPRLRSRADQSEAGESRTELGEHELWLALSYASSNLFGSYEGCNESV